MVGLNRGATVVKRKKKSIKVMRIFLPTTIADRVRLISRVRVCPHSYGRVARLVARLNRVSNGWLQNGFFFSSSSFRTLLQNSFKIFPRDGFRNAAKELGNKIEPSVADESSLPSSSSPYGRMRNRGEIRR